MQAELYSKLYKICQQFKNRNNLNINLPPKNIAELKLWYSVHVDLIASYSKSIRHQQLYGAIIRNNSSLTCMMMIDPATGWFNIVETPMYNIDEVMGGDYEYIDKSSSRVNQLFNKTWLCIYPRPRKFVFDNVSEF